MAYNWTPEQRLQVTSAILAGLCGNSVLSTSTTVARTMVDTADLIAKDMLNKLAGVVETANQSTITQRVPPTIIQRPDGLE